ncbi:hypothetical protein AYI69_g7850, partial [Smittium culicis]
RYYRHGVNKKAYYRPDDVYAYIPESSGCSQQIDCSNRVVNPEHNLQQDHLSLWYPRRGPICNQEEHQGTQLIQLVPGQGSSRNQRLVSQLDPMVQPVLLSTLEPDPTATWYPDLLKLTVQHPIILEASVIVLDPKSGKSPMTDNKRQTDQLKTKDLTAKTCWLIAICGLMRASDIHRIDDIRTIRKDNSVVFVILAPKEKRQGRPIERPCEIKSHTNLMFCPVHAYDV